VLPRTSSDSSLFRRSRRTGDAVIWQRMLYAAVVMSGGFLAACSPVPGEPAPVYMMGGTATHERAASAPLQRAMAPVALAPSPAPSTSVRHTAPDVIPLDGPPQARAAGPVPARVPSSAPSATASLSPPAAPPPVGVRTEPETAKADPVPAALPHGAHFSWPLNGRVLTSYGAVTGGSHNDGINIAAPRDTPIAAIEGGTVAYAGNELRGYGDLVLIKHADGWISAYAHCDELLVKKGDQVYRGEAIAKVGATGNVNEPQLYFELRRGKQPVDPRQFLATAPIATDARVAG
jgi:murein DD-endopeptidase MepM/ murein hydrolase activator NlpD